MLQKSVDYVVKKITIAVILSENQGAVNFCVKKIFEFLSLFWLVQILAWVKKLPKSNIKVESRASKRFSRTTCGKISLFTVKNYVKFYIKIRQHEFLH